jgi:hypothetical protein
MRLTCVPFVFCLCAWAQPASPVAVQAYVPHLTPISYVQPVVGPELKNTPGLVQVLLTIDRDGGVVQAEVLSGPNELREAAVSAAKKQRYRPVQRNGQPVAAYTDGTVFFYVQGKPGTGPPDMAGQMKAMSRLQEVQQQFPRSPAQVFEDNEDQARGATGSQRFYALDELAKSALLANLPDKATAYANELLLSAPKYRKDWNYGNAIHDGNLVLGLLAVRAGNVPAARQYLLEAGSTPGSPQLNSFGPDMSLAKALLEKGEREAVLEYFSRCSAFWAMGKDRLEEWSATVRGGGIPGFRMNARFAR